MSEPQGDALFTAEEDFWLSWIENKEMLAQAKDSELAKRLETLPLTPSIPGRFFGSRSDALT